MLNFHPNLTEFTENRQNKTWMSFSSLLKINSLHGYRRNLLCVSPWLQVWVGGACCCVSVVQSGAVWGGSPSLTCSIIRRWDSPVQLLQPIRDWLRVTWRYLCCTELTCVSVSLRWTCCPGWWRRSLMQGEVSVTSTLDHTWQVSLKTQTGNMSPVQVSRKQKHLMVCEFRENIRTFMLCK